jgi:hypothetical protein
VTAEKPISRFSSSLDVQIPIRIYVAAVLVDSGLKPVFGVRWMNSETITILEICSHLRWQRKSARRPCHSRACENYVQVDHKYVIIRHHIRLDDVVLMLEHQTPSKSVHKQPRYSVSKLIPVSAPTPTLAINFTSGYPTRVRIHRFPSQSDVK